MAMVKERPIYLTYEQTSFIPMLINFWTFEDAGVLKQRQNKLTVC